MMHGIWTPLYGILVCSLLDDRLLRLIDSAACRTGPLSLLLCACAFQQCESPAAKQVDDSPSTSFCL